MTFFVDINVSIEVLGPAGVLFNDVLSDLDFKLTGLVLKAYWPFFKEADLTSMHNFMSF